MTIALGAALGARNGADTYQLALNDAAITVEPKRDAEGWTATLASPPTRSRAATREEASDAMALFELTADDFDDRLPPAHIHGGADHVMLALRDRARLAEMDYDLDRGRDVMRWHGLVRPAIRPSSAFAERPPHG